MQNADPKEYFRLDNVVDGMLLCHVFNIKDVKHYDFPGIRTVYTVALVFEWAVEALRPFFSPSKVSSIAGCPSILDDQNLTSARGDPALVKKAAICIEDALRRPKYITADFVPHSRKRAFPS